MTAVTPGACIAVTGATGFVGQALVENLNAAGYTVIGISERPQPPAQISSLLSDYHCADLVQKWPATRPFAGLIHLAGLAAVGPSFEHPQEYINKNSSMVTNLFEHLLNARWRGRALVISSGAVYGSASRGTAFSEDSPSNPTSPYVVSKMLVENQTEYYSQRGLEALVARPFNHIGRGQGQGFIVPDLTEKVRESIPGSAIKVGNLNAARDYTDVRDIVNAYRLLLEANKLNYRTYNVCSGAARTGWEVLAAVCRSLQRQVPPTQFDGGRAIDPEVLRGDAQRLTADTGWKPTLTLEESVDDFVLSLRNNAPAAGPSRPVG